MQVFVPFASFEETARVLDRARLQKQILECYQMLGAILAWPTKDGKPRTGYLAHTAVIGWQHHPRALARYALCCVDEMVRRGYKQSCYYDVFQEVLGPGAYSLPPWLGNEAIHSSHRARLLQKDFTHYSAFNWEEALAPDLADRLYQWPIYLPESQVEYTLETRAAKPTTAEALKQIEAANALRLQQAAYRATL